MIRQEVCLKDRSIITITEKSGKALEDVMVKDNKPQFVRLTDISGSRMLLATNEIIKIRENEWDRILKRATDDVRE